MGMLGFLSHEKEPSIVMGEVAAPVLNKEVMEPQPKDVNKTMEVLTAKSGKFQISDELRSMLVLLGDGRLIISKSHQFSPHVRGFISRLNQLNHAHVITHSDLSVIEKFYENTIATSDHSDMQRESKKLFGNAVNLRSSDIHIRVSKRERTRIFFRIHDDLQFMEEHSYEYGHQLCSTIYQAMADVSDSTFETMSRQDARISEKSKLHDKLDGIRIATSPQVDGFIMVLRLLYNDTTNDFDLRKLGFSPENIDAIEYMKKRPTGVIIIGGPTGSGKSTTLQRVLGAINQESEGTLHIISVEDPPEYPIPGIVQTPVTNADSEEARSREYQKAIKAAMRLDPNIIMLSEVRDPPTARLVVQAAMTGHQVWTTVHANSALAIIDRFMDLGVDKDLLTDPTIIAGLMCQRLIKLLCPSCKKPIADEMHRFKESDRTRFMSALTIQSVCVRGEGCAECRKTGVIGRTVVSETVVTDNQLMKHIKDGDRIAAIDYVRQQNGKSMLEHAIDKINQGLVDPLQAEAVVGALSAVIIERDHRVSQAELRSL